jgi:hypothetical protein
MNLRGHISASSLYAIVNFRGIMPTHIPTMRNIHAPPRVNVFLWLLAYNKFFTKENLNKQTLLDFTCLFFSEQ